MKSVKSYQRIEGKSSGNSVIIVSMLLTLCLLSLIKAKYSSPHGNQQLPRKNAKLLTELTDLVANKPICSQTSNRSNVCDVIGDVRVKASTHTILFTSSQTQQHEWTNKPYARTNDPAAMHDVKQWTLTRTKNRPACTTNHSVPAVVFSVAGFTGNLFHDFSDVIVPLFITSYQFRGEVQFIISDVKPWWVTRFADILAQLSNYDIIDAENDGEEVRCFPRVIIGLDYHKELAVDASKTPGGYSMDEFRQVLRKAFKLERAKVDTKRKPRLLIISRGQTRVLLNERAMTDMAMSLGFDVRVAEPASTSDIGKFARLVNSADVMIGVHGSGLTNMVFLPDNAVMVQLVPLGGLDWLVKESFEARAGAMKLKYIGYEIVEEESSLSEEYPKGHPVLSDPYNSVHKKGWSEISRIYLENQNLRPHLGRLRKTFIEALKILPRKENYGDFASVR